MGELRRGRRKRLGVDRHIEAAPLESRAATAGPNLPSGTYQGTDDHDQMNIVISAAAGPIIGVDGRTYVLSLQHEHYGEYLEYSFSTLWLFYDDGKYKRLSTANCMDVVTSATPSGGRYTLDGDKMTTTPAGPGVTEHWQQVD